ncbi:MAG: hypothetical protein GY757_06635 [bacterium]|nr:hypothetical protein [bacterium]
MTFTRTTFILLLFIPMLFSALLLPAGEEREGCSTAVITGDASLYGTPMLWKNRDTPTLSNKVIYVKESPFNYIALVNARETSGRWVYAGLNSEGFGIMNSVAYNLPKDESEMVDLEGLIMSDALRTCRSVADFEKALQKNLGPGMGSWANFGVIDAEGNAVLFETHNNGYKKINAADSPDKYLVNTNFARSGTKGMGEGYLRFQQATALFKKIPAAKISHETIFENIARSVGHPLMKHPTLKELEKISVNQPVWIYNWDCINRPSTASAAVINGRIPGKKESIATFWIQLGEPVITIAVPVWVEAGETPLPLYEGKKAPICAASMNLKKRLYPSREGSKGRYMQVSRLVNKEKTGFLPSLLETEKEIFEETARFLKIRHTPKELAAFQSKMAKKALKVLTKLGAAQN